MDIGHILRRLPPQDRSDHIFGSGAWHGALGYPSTTSFRSDPFHNQIHADYLHLSFELETGIDNQDLEALCERVNAAAPRLPDERRLHFSAQVNEVVRPILDAQKRRVA